MGQRRVRPQICDEATRRGTRRRGEAQDARLSVELVEDVEDRPVAAASGRDDRGQVLAAEPVHVRRGERVDVHARRQVGDRAHEREQQPDLRAGVQARRARETPRHSRDVQRPQDRVGRRVGTDEDRVIAWPRAALDPPRDLRGHPVGLLRARPECLQPNGHRAAARPLGPEPLHDPGPDLEAVGIVEPDEPVGCVEDRRPRAVVASQHDRACRPVARLELEDIADRGTPELVDRLVVVADHRDVAMHLREQGHELGLGTVRVLELVDQDVSIAALQRTSNGRRLADQPQGERDLVAEVHEPAAPEQFVVALVGAGEFEAPARLVGQCLGLGPLVGGNLAPCRDPGLGRARLGTQRLRVGDERGGRDVLVLATREQGRERAQEAGRVAQRPVLVELEVEQMLAQEDHGLGSRQDPDVGRQPELQRVLADDPIAECVEGRDRGVRIAVRHELVDPRRHLLGRLVGEGQGEDLGRSRPAGGDEPGDASRDDLGLAGAGAGHDEQWPVAMGDRPELVLVEPAQQSVEPGVVGRRAAGRFVPPDWNLLERHRLRPATRQLDDHRPIIDRARVSSPVTPRRAPAHRRIGRPRSPGAAPRPPRSTAPRRPARRSGSSRRPASRCVCAGC